MSKVGELKIELGLDMRPLKNGLKEAKKLMSQFAKTKQDVQMDADIKKLTSSLNSAKKKLDSFSKGVKPIKMDMDTKSLTSSINTAQKKVDGLANGKKDIKMGADIKGVTSSVNTAQKQIDKLTNGKYTVKINADVKTVSKSLSSIQKEISKTTNGKQTVKIVADEKGFMTSIKSVKREMDKISKGKKQVKIDGDIKGLLSALKDAKKKLDSIVKKKYVVKIDADIKGLNSNVKTAQKSVNKLTSGTKSVKITANINSLNSSIRTANRQVSRLTGSTQTVNINANTTQATNQVNKLKEKLDSLKDFGEKMSTRVTLPAIGLGTLSVKSSIDNQRMENKTQATLGISKEDAKGMNDTSKQIYTSGFGESLQDTNDAITRVRLNMKDLNSTNLFSVTKGALTLRDVFDADINQSTRTANTMMKTFGMQGRDAMDLITVGFQKGGNYYDDMLDTLNEYSVHFKKIGMDGKDMMNILIQGAQQGAWNVDKVGDAIKEFGIRAIDGSKTSIDGFQSIGLNADMMAQKIRQGGDSGKQAFMATVTALAGVKDKVEQNRIGVELFGTQWEDLREEVILALDPTKDALGETSGAMDELNKNMENKTVQSLRALSTAFYDLKVAVGDILAPILQTFAGLLQGLIEWFNGLSESTQQFIVIGVIIASLLGPLAIGFGIVSFAVQTTVGLFKSIWSAGTFVVNAFRGIFLGTGPLAGGLAGVTASTLGTIMAWAGLIIAGGFVITHLKEIGYSAVSFGNAFVGVFVTIQAKATQMWYQMIADLARKWNSFVGGFKADFLKIDVGAIVTKGNNSLKGDKELMADLYKNSQDAVKKADEAWKNNKVNKFWGGIKDAFDGAIKMPDSSDLLPDPKDAVKDYQDAFNGVTAPDMPLNTKPLKGIGDKIKSSSPGKAVKNQAEEAKKATDEYKSSIDKLSDSIKSQSKSFRDQISMMDSFTRKSVSMGTLLNRQRRRANEYTEWQKARNTLLNSSVLSDSAKSQISDMGVDRTAEMKALARANVSQLKQWNDYNSHVEAIAKQEAVKAVYNQQVTVNVQDRDANKIAEAVMKQLNRQGVRVK